MLNILTGYDSQLPTTLANGDSTGLYIFKYQTSGNDTIVYVLQSGTHDDSHFDYDLDFGGATTFCQVINMAKGDLDGARTTGTPVAGVLHLDDIGETPVYVRVVLQDEPATQRTLYRNRVIIRQ